jgi:hypothetical protein
VPARYAAKTLREALTIVEDMTRKDNQIFYLCCPYSLNFQMGFLVLIVFRLFASHLGGALVAPSTRKCAVGRHNIYKLSLPVKPEAPKFQP